jgi:Carboxypeptidase regulatory-like domain
MKKALGFCWLLCTTLSLFAQSNTGSIVGTIKGVDGAVVPNVAVTITHQQTNRQFTITTNGDGYYVSPPLTVGDYQVEAKLSGFKTGVQSGVTLQIQQTAVVDFTLQVGALTDQVTVTAATPVLETTSTTLGKVVDNKRILELPLNSRNVYSLIFLTPGVSGSIGNNYNSLSYCEWRAPFDDGHRD